jgi:hypothetical protein
VDPLGTVLVVPPADSIELPTCDRTVRWLDHRPDVLMRTAADLAFKRPASAEVRMSTSPAPLVSPQ